MSTQTTQPAQTTESNVLRDYLREVRPHLPLRQCHDILMELESNVLDRVDFLATAEHRDPDEELFRRAVAELGRPQEVAAAYVQDRYLVAPEAFRPFVIYTCMAFVVHVVLIGIATATGRSLHVGLFPIWPVGPHGILSLLSAVIHALLLDVGMAAVLFGIAGALRRNLTPTPTTFAVDASPRQAGGRAVLALLVTVVVGWFRDEIFVVWAGGRSHPLITDWGEAALPLLVGLLVFAAVKELLYVLFRERRMTVAVDGLHGVTGLVLCLYLVSGGALLAIPEIQGSDAYREPVNAFLGQICTLVLAASALLFAIKTLRRSARFAQL